MFLSLRQGGRFLVGAAVRLEEARERELAQAVAHHLFGDVDRQELAAVVDGEGVPDELRRDHAGARPRLDLLLLAGLVHLLDFFQKLRVNERSLLGGWSNSLTSKLVAWPCGGPA